LSKTVAIIPARGGSKRLPNKNLKLLGNLPLIAHSINYAKANAGIIDDIYVTTDSDTIKNIALEYGANVIDRPKELSGDLEPTITALKHAISILEDVETVVLLQPTNPLRPKSLMIEAFTIFKDNNFDSLFTVSRDYKKLGKIIDNKYKPFNYKIGQRSQDLQPLYFENGLLYITKSSIIKAGKIISKNSFPLEINHLYAHVDIDTSEHLKYAEYLLSKPNIK